MVTTMTPTTTSSASQVVIGTLIDGESAWLSPAAATSYQQMRAAGMPSGGITSAGRSSTAQAGLYQAYLNGTGNLAAKPGTSPHEKGLALDINIVSAAYRWLQANGRRYGWTQAVPGEAWHWQYGGSGASSSSGSNPLSGLANALADVPIVGPGVAAASGLIGGANNAASSALGLNDLASSATTVMLRLVFVVGGIGLVVLGLARVVAPRAQQLASTLGAAS